MEKFKEKKWVLAVKKIAFFCSLVALLSIIGLFFSLEFCLYAFVFCPPTTLLLMLIYTRSQTRDEYTIKFLDYYWAKEKECKTKEQFEQLYQEIYDLSTEDNMIKLSFPLSIKELLRTIDNKISLYGN